MTSRGSHIVKTIGKGLLVEFESVADAIQCAVEVQNGLAGGNADGVAVDVELKRDRRILVRPASRPWLDPAKAGATIVKLFHENIDHAHQIAITEPVVQPLRKQLALAVINPRIAKHHGRIVKHHVVTVLPDNTGLIDVAGGSGFAWPYRPE